jgi:hypothetical protein
MWVTLVLLIFITIWMSLTFTGMLCDNEYVGMGLCYDAAWKAKRPVSFCPPCAPAPAPTTAPAPAPRTTSTYEVEPY